MYSVAWMMQVVLCSVCLIAIVHHLFHYLKNTLTTPKVKYLDNLPSKYENMYRIIQKERTPEPDPPLFSPPPQNKTNKEVNHLENTSSIQDLPIDLSLHDIDILPPSASIIPTTTTTTTTTYSPLMNLENEGGEKNKEHMKNVLKDFLKSSKDDIVSYNA